MGRSGGAHPIFLHRLVHAAGAVAFEDLRRLGRPFGEVEQDLLPSGLAVGQAYRLVEVLQWNTAPSPALPAQASTIATTLA